MIIVDYLIAIIIVLIFLGLSVLIEEDYKLDYRPDYKKIDRLERELEIGPYKDSYLSDFSTERREKRYEIYGK